MGNAEKQTKQKIMEIAKEHFSRYGYAGTNLEAIGKEAGVTRGPLYYYFKNKKELYAAGTGMTSFRGIWLFSFLGVLTH